MKNTVKNIKENYKLVLLVFIIGLFLGWIVFHPSRDERTSEIQVEGHEGHDDAVDSPSIWTCSMHPQIKQDAPGQCPLCAMDLIPINTVQLTGDDVDPDEVVMTKSAAKLADIETMLVARGTPQKTVYLQGKVQADERNIAKLTARFGGRIENLFVNFTGQNVRKGEKLATIYSPDLISAQRELIEAISFKESRPSFYTAAKEKLKSWDLTEDQIRSIEEKGEPQLYFEVLSPISGTVMMRHVTLGEYVKEGATLFQVTNLRKVWVMLDAYESDLPWIKVGDPVKLNIQSIPGKDYEGKVAYIDPFIDDKLRSAKVRIVLSNSTLELKPGMFAGGVLHSKIAETMDNLLIPRSSILWTGKRSVVYVKVPDRDSPSFLYREIILGPEAGNFYVVIKGLDEGEEIAVNGVFKIDAAAQLEGKTSMMNPEGGIISTIHNHSGTSLGDEEMILNEETNMDTKNMIDNTPVNFQKQLAEVTKSYLTLKDAFVKSDEQAAKIAAEDAILAIKNVDKEVLSGEAQSIWMKLRKTILDNLNGIHQMDGIEMKRSHFGIVSDKLLEAIKQYGMHSAEINTLYLEFCPMAFDNKGAYWISDSKEIMNPYFGDDMLHCGEVKEILNKN